MTKIFFPQFKKGKQGIEIEKGNILNSAGGAYEGATISSGVRAVEGAIKNVRIVNGRVQYETIGNKPPLGICGSGLIDLLGEMRKKYPERLNTLNPTKRRRIFHT